jgi:single-stranded DNA-binding protein
MTPPMMVGLAGRLSRHPSLRAGRTGQFCTSAIVHRSDSRAPQLTEVVAFGDAARALERLQRGDSVVVVGRMEERRWTDPDGSERSQMRMVVGAVGLDAAVEPRPRRARNGIPQSRSLPREG